MFIRLATGVPYTSVNSENTYYISGRITVHITSGFTGVDSAVANLINIL